MCNKHKHLALVRRDELIDLFKYGTIYPGASISFTGMVDSMPARVRDMEKLFDKVPAIEYSTNYFLLYAETEKKTALLSQGLATENLREIFPLDDDAARFGVSLEPPVVLSGPIFAENFRNYQIKTAVGNARKGVANIEKIFGFNKLFLAVKQFTEKKSLPELVSLIMDENGSLAPRTIWEHLLCYNRSQTYPNDARGTFLDTMSVIRNYSKQQIVMKDETQTTTGRKVLELQGAKYHELVECVESSPEFIKTATKAYPDFWKIAPLYFILLNIMSKVSPDGTKIQDKPLNSFIDSVKNHYDPAHLKPALLMLGITMGHTSTYKMLYAINKTDYHFLK